MQSQAEKGRRFRAYHDEKRTFVIPNPWDPGTARLLAHLEFKALATTSAGFAFSRGVPDSSVDRDRMMQHLNDIASSTDLPVSADLENGYGDAPEVCAATIVQAAAAGVVGGSIEDATNRLDEPIYALDLAVERVRAAAEAARSLPFPFVLTARTENYRFGRTDLGDTIRRLQAYQEAGADVLYAPGLSRREDIEAVVSSVDRPVNVNIGWPGMDLTVMTLAEIGVKRVSVGGSLARAALSSFLRAADELKTYGSAGYEQDSVSSKGFNALFQAIRTA